MAHKKRHIFLLTERMHTGAAFLNSGENLPFLGPIKRIQERLLAIPTQVGGGTTLTFRRFLR